MSKRPHTFKNLLVEDGAVSEGSAKITLPKGEVFYNPVQQFNRDLSISVISAFQRMYLNEAKLKKRTSVTFSLVMLIFIKIEQNWNLYHGSSVGNRS
jgi:tRNA G26 N,N-dimethylase Trm1